MRLTPSFHVGMYGRYVHWCSLERWSQDFGAQMTAGEPSAGSGWQTAERHGQPQPDKMLLLLSGCNKLKTPKIRQREEARGREGGRSCVRNSPSSAGVEEELWLPRKVKAGQQTTQARNPQTDKQSRHLVRSRHRCNQWGFGTDFDTARISLVISSVQPVWGGCSLRKAAGTGLQIELNLCEAKNNT